MDPDTSQKLHEVFSTFSTSPEGIDGTYFARLCRKLNFKLSCLRGVPIIEKSVFDIIFAQNKTRGRRRLDFNQFLISLDQIGVKFGMSIEEVISALCSLDDDKSVPKDRFQSGPSRFFYDTSTYTGTAAHFDPETSPNRVIDLSEFVNRENPQPWTTPHSARYRPPTADSTPNRGPARFFYDKTTYTGTHRQGSDANTGRSTRMGDETNRMSIEGKNLFGTKLLLSEANTAVATPVPKSSLPIPNPSFIDQVMYLPPVDSYFESFLRYN